MVVDRTEMLGAGAPSAPKKPIMSFVLLGLGAIGCTACDQSKSIGLDVAGCVATHGDKEFDLLTNGRPKVLFRENSNLVVVHGVGLVEFVHHVDAHEVRDLGASYVVEFLDARMDRTLEMRLGVESKSCLAMVQAWLHRKK